MAALAPDGIGTAPIVFFDGACPLCNRSVAFLARHDRSGRLFFAHLQGEIAARHLDPALRNVAQDGTVVLPEPGARAVGQCAQRGGAAPWRTRAPPGPPRPPRRLAGVPRVLDVAYGFVAAPARRLVRTPRAPCPRPDPRPCAPASRWRSGRRSRRIRAARLRVGAGIACFSPVALPGSSGIQRCSCPSASNQATERKIRFNRVSRRTVSRSPTTTIANTIAAGARATGRSFRAIVSTTRCCCAGVSSDYTGSASTLGGGALGLGQRPWICSRARRSTAAGVAGSGVDLAADLRARVQAVAQRTSRGARTHVLVEDARVRLDRRQRRRCRRARGAAARPARRTLGARG